MTTIALFYGSTNGTTAEMARRIQQAFAVQYEQNVEVLDIADYFLEEMLNFDVLILGIPTWNIGQLQRDWDSIFDEFDNLDLSNKRVALFGLGDQVGYPQTFVDAMFFLAEKVVERGAHLIGRWKNEGYHFERSWALQADGLFVGLVLDEENQAQQSDARIGHWVTQVMRELM